MLYVGAVQTSVRVSTSNAFSPAPDGTKSKPSATAGAPAMNVSLGADQTTLPVAGSSATMFGSAATNSFSRAAVRDAEVSYRCSQSSSPVLASYAVTWE